MLDFYKRDFLKYFDTMKIQYVQVKKELESLKRVENPSDDQKELLRKKKLELAGLETAINLGQFERDALDPNNKKKTPKSKL